MGIGLGSLNPVRIVQGKGAIGEALGPAAPVIAGLALNTLAPGVGAAIGSSLGLGAAAGTGALVGGITALASGNLQQGLMAGLGAYGGASVGAGLASMGSGEIAKTAGAGLTGDAASDAVAGKLAETSTLDKMGAGLGYAAQNPTEALKSLGEGSMLKGAGILSAAAAPVLAGQMVQTATPAPSQSPGLIRPYEFNRKVITPTDMVQASYQPGQSTRERNWFEDSYTALPTYKSPGPEYKAEGGEIRMASGGDVQTDPNMQQVPAFEPVVRMGFGGSIFDAIKSIKDAIPAAQQQTGPKYEGLPSYNYDPETQSFIRDYGVGPAPVKTRDGDYASNGGFSSGIFGGGLRSLINDINYGVAKRNYNQALDAAIEKDPNYIARKKMSQFAFDPQTQSFARVSPDDLKAQMITTATPPPTTTPATAPIENIGVGFGFADGGLAYAEGGVTGSGSLNLNIPLNLGGGQNDVEGYQAAGSGGGNSSSFTAPSVSGGMFSQAGAGGYGPPMDPRMMQGGLDPRAIAANPQGFQQMLQMAQQRERMMPGTTFLSQMGSMGLGALRMAEGGSIPSLGGYASGGNPRLLKGPGDGMSDNIPAVIGNKQPARLADGEFVVPADVVSHLGNGSTEAGAKQLYKMMDRIRQQRTGKKKQAPEVNPMKAMPA